MSEPDLFLLFVRPLNRAGILNVSGPQINQADLEEWVQRQGVKAEWEKVLENK